MYSTFANHFDKIIHFVFAFITLYVILPKLIFWRKEGDIIEDAINNYIKMVFFVICAGYLFVIIKSFEVLFIIYFVVFVIYLRNRLIDTKVKKDDETWKEFILDLADKKIDLKERVRLKVDRHRGKIIGYFKNIENVIVTILLMVVFIYSAYLRFYDAFIDSATQLSDSFTMLAWMKHIGEQVLFYLNGGEVYPRGISIYMESLHTFSFVDALYTLKYAGPLSSIITIFTIYYIIVKLSENKFAGILGASTYGLLAFMLNTSVERQASSNAQEFAFVFMMPAFYSVYLYLSTKERKYLLSFGYAFATIGLIHSFVYAYVLMVVAAVVVVALMINFNEYKRTFFPILTFGVVSGLISVIPFGIGFVQGIGMHSTSTEFLFATEVNLKLPPLRLFDNLALWSLLLCLIHSLYDTFIKEKKNLSLFPSTFVLVVGAVSFGFFYYGGVITNSVLISARAGEIWSVIEALLVGYGFYVALIPANFLLKGRGYIVNSVAMIIIVFISIFVVKPQPYRPYKMEWNSKVEQYLRIDEINSPTTWTLVSEKEQYSLVFGRGFHMYISSFVEMFDPKKKEAHKWEKISDNVYIYYEKNIYKVSENNSIYQIEKDYYAQKEKDLEKLKGWIADYKKYHDNLSVFYEDENLIVYNIKNQYSKGKRLKTNSIWEVDG